MFKIWEGVAYRNKSIWGSRIIKSGAPPHWYIHYSRARVVFLADIMRIKSYRYHTTIADVRNFFCTQNKPGIGPVSSKIVRHSYLYDLSRCRRIKNLLAPHPHTPTWRPAGLFPCAISYLAPCPLFIYFFYFYFITCLLLKRRSYSLCYSKEKRFVCKLNDFKFLL